MNTEQEFAIAEDQVEEILKHNPLTRGSNKLFLVAVMQSSGMGLTTQQVEIFTKQMFALETYTRAKRFFQEKGEYLPDSSTHQFLQHKEEEVRSHYSKTKRERRSRGQIKLLDTPKADYSKTRFVIKPDGTAVAII